MTINLIIIIIVEVEPLNVMRWNEMIFPESLKWERFKETSRIKNGSKFVRSVHSKIRNWQMIDTKMNDMEMNDIKMNDKRGCM